MQLKLLYDMMHASYLFKEFFTMEHQLCVPSLFGLEGLISDELKRLDMKNVRAENGRVLFTGTNIDIARANINLRTGERVLLVIGSVRAESFDALFEGVKAMSWEKYIPKDGAFRSRGMHLIPNCIPSRTASASLKKRSSSALAKSTSSIGLKKQAQNIRSSSRS